MAYCYTCGISSQCKTNGWVGWWHLVQRHHNGQSFFPLPEYQVIETLCLLQGASLGIQWLLPLSEFQQSPRVGRMSVAQAVLSIIYKCVRKSFNLNLFWWRLKKHSSGLSGFWDTREYNADCQPDGRRCSTSLTCPEKNDIPVAVYKGIGHANAVLIKYFIHCSTSAWVLMEESGIRWQAAAIAMLLTMQL